MPLPICKYELCETTARWIGYCFAHHKQFVRGEVLRPVRGSRHFWLAQLNEQGEKRCSRCSYWLPLEEFNDRRDGSPVNREFGRAHCRRCNILRRMGITARDYDEMLAAQGGGCKVCGRVDEVMKSGKRLLSVDHDHRCCPSGRSCGKCIRGILCNHCNAALGYAGDDAGTLRALATYLEACPVR